MTCRCCGEYEISCGTKKIIWPVDIDSLKTEERLREEHPSREREAIPD
jgi:hypothetical protein